MIVPVVAVGGALLTWLIATRLLYGWMDEGSVYEDLGLSLALGFIAAVFWPLALLGGAVFVLIGATVPDVRRHFLQRRRQKGLERRQAALQAVRDRELRIAALEAEIAAWQPKDFDG